MLGITFNNENDYDLIQEDDTFNFLDLSEFSPGKNPDHRSCSLRWYQRRYKSKPYIQHRTN